MKSCHVLILHFHQLMELAFESSEKLGSHDGTTCKWHNCHEFWTHPNLITKTNGDKLTFLKGKES